MKTYLYIIFFFFCVTQGQQKIIQNLKDLHLVYTSHAYAMCIDKQCVQQAFLQQSLILHGINFKNAIIAKQRIGFADYCAFAIWAVVCGPLSYSDVHKDIIVENCTIDNLIIYSGSVYLRNCAVNSLSRSNHANVRVDQDCVIGSYHFSDQ
ncbi:hypothetical protein EKK58_03845 [Candidatus Dependentiae bacterium]|nr:MAG: hypothetical protein EKK58_03845 [Candidatus Dependentiae bacterium]